MSAGPTTPQGGQRGVTSEYEGLKQKYNYDPSQVQGPRSGGLNLYGVSDDLLNATIIWNISPPLPARQVRSTGAYPDTRPGEYMGYFPGGQLKDTRTGQQALGYMYGLAPKDLSQLQQMLYLGGLYGSGYYGKTPQQLALGVADDDTYGAWKSLVQQSARSGIPIFQLLGQLAGSGGAQRLNAGAGGGGSQRAPLAIRQTSPDDIKAVAEKVAQEVYGETATPAVVGRIVNAYHLAEASYQRAAYAASYAGGTVTEPPTLETFATDQLEQADPTAAGAHTVADDVVTSFLNIVGGPFGANAGGG